MAKLETESSDSTPQSIQEEKPQTSRENVNSSQEEVFLRINYLGDIRKIRFLIDDITFEEFESVIRREFCCIASASITAWYVDVEVPT